MENREAISRLYAFRGAVTGEMRRGVVLFDGLCALCDGSVRFLLDHDARGRLGFAPLQGSTAREVLERHPSFASVDEALSTVLYVRDLGEEKERVFARSDAAIEILEDLGGPFRLAAGLRVVPRPIRDAVYGFIARHRYRWFGKLSACRLPDERFSERFLP